MINSSNQYALWAYEMGFKHALVGVERPIKGQADSAYILGYNTAKEMAR